MTSPDIQLALMSESAIILTSQTEYDIAPLTPEAGMGQPANTLKALGYYGNLQTVGASSASNLSSTTIAYMSCDPNDSSNIDATAAIVMAGAGQSKPTGAIRAHRHPERYGPRGGLPGRPRQSRAKGLARAMLETLPIVKFGDPEPTKPENRDIELENGSIHHAPAEVAVVTDGAADDSKAPRATTTATMSGTVTDNHTDSERAAEAGANEGDLGCSICTEDFTTGEDVRVLPCKHKYHPACIDPWLLNVSGTCPLCRHDLRPTTTNAENDNELPPPLNGQEGENSNEQTTATTETGEHPSRRRVSRFIDLHRLRHAPPDERIAALRQLREQSQREGAEPSNSSTEERNRRASVTDRLRNKFRIRTRPEAAGSSEPSTGA
ncbi:ring finger domain protein [Rutstroemia sp. NJR-2017a BBW]|nr:ring finger domain protein [Rutstroemia sp. NJR-2017a BBW]